MFIRYCFRNRQTNIFRVFTEKETDCGIVIVWCSADCILFPRWQADGIQVLQSLSGFGTKAGCFAAISGSGFDTSVVECMVSIPIAGRFTGIFIPDSSFLFPLYIIVVYAC